MALLLKQNVPNSREGYCRILLLILLFNWKWKPLHLKKALVMAKNKDRRIKQFVNKHCWLIASSAMDTAQTHHSHLLLLWIQTQICWKWWSQKAPPAWIFIWCLNVTHYKCFSEIRQRFAAQHLMFVHAITGSDSVSALFKGRRESLHCLMVPTIGTVFHRPDSSHDEMFDRCSFWSCMELCGQNH